VTLILEILGLRPGKGTVSGFLTGVVSSVHLEHSFSDRDE